MDRRSWLAMASAVAVAPFARAAAYPERQVRLVVGAPPGGPGDFLGRLYARTLAAALRQPFVVDNKPGASGTLAAEAVVRSPADGHTLLVSGPAPISAAPHLLKLGYDPAVDLVPVSMLGTGAFVLAVHPSVRAANVRELADLARAQPGRLSYGSGGNGSASHLCTELFCTALRVRMNHVPYKGEGQAVTDLLSGQIQLMFTAPNVALRHARAGTLRLLACTASERMRNLPQLPTVAESGVPGFEYLAWQAVFAPAATPAAAIEALVGAWNAARIAPAVQGPLEELGMASPDRIASGAPLAAFLRGEAERLGQVIRQAGIKPE